MGSTRGGLTPDDATSEEKAEGEGTPDHPSITHTNHSVEARTSTRHSVLALPRRRRMHARMHAPDTDDVGASSRPRRGAAVGSDERGGGAGGRGGTLCAPRTTCACTVRKAPPPPRARNGPTSGANERPQRHRVPGVARGVWGRLRQSVELGGNRGATSAAAGYTTRVSRIAARTRSDDDGLDAARRAVQGGARPAEHARARAHSAPCARWQGAPLQSRGRPRLRSGVEGRGLRLSHLPWAAGGRIPARAATRIRTRHARAQPPTPDPPRGAALQPPTPRALRRQHKRVPWRFLERGTTGPSDGGSEPAPLRVSSPGGSERRTTRGLTRPRARRTQTLAPSRGTVSRRSLPRVSSRERARPRETRRSADLLVPSAEHSPRAGRG